MTRRAFAEEIQEKFKIPVTNDNQILPNLSRNHWRSGIHITEDACDSLIPHVKYIHEEARTSITSAIYPV